MLTSLYYYNYYKPYIYGTETTSRSKKIGKTQKNENNSRFSGIETKDYVHGNTETSAFFLNYSDKNEVRNVISGISDNVNGIKDTVHYLQNVKKGRNARFDNGQEAFGDGLEDLASDYNSLISFSERKNVSSDIKQFGGRVKELMSENGELLKEVGISIDGDTAEFDPAVYATLSSDEYNEKSEHLGNLFKNIYEDAVNVLSKPMSDHLNFKSLDLYYNYGYTTTKSEPFRFLDTGLVVDITL